MNGAYLMVKTPDDSWKINNILIAEWAIEQLKDAEKELDAVKEWAREEVEKQQRRHDETVSFFKRKLADYMENCPQRVTKTTVSTELPSAKLVWRQQQPEYQKDNDVLLDWAKKNAPDAVKVTENIEWSKIKAGGEVHGEVFVSKETGEVIPGITVIERPMMFQVSMKGEKENV